MVNGLQATIKSKKSRFGVYCRGVQRGSVAIGSQGMQAILLSREEVARRCKATV